MLASTKTYTYGGSGDDDLPASYTSLVSEQGFAYNAAGVVSAVTGDASYNVAYDYDAWG